MSYADQQSLTHPVPEYAKKLTGKALVDYVNSHQSFFRAKYIPNAEEFLKARVMDEKYGERFGDVPVKKQMYHRARIPESFDARKQWPRCPTIGYIRDQSACASGWAMTAASVLGDRACIQTNGTIRSHLSEMDMLSCCGYDCRYWCEGGYALRAFKYAMGSGVVTGGRYGEKGVCKPYAFYPCGVHENQTYYGPCPSERFTAPKCRHRCQFRYSLPYQKDKIYGQYPYYLPMNATAIMYEIMTHGPVAARLFAYEDLYHYKGGIYVHTGGKSYGLQPVRIIGWGEENGVLYWLVANSWNTDWGENGFFRILRNENHCLIETDVIGVLVDV